jgi:hypothetical protein
MGLVYAEIELINGGDLEMARRHIIGEEEVKRMTVTALVDTGSICYVLTKTYRSNCNYLLLKKEKYNQLMVILFNVML